MRERLPLVRFVVSVVMLLAMALVMTGCGGDGATNPTVTPAPVASAVGGFNQVTISWPAVTGATSYNIYWSATSGVTPANGTKIANATSPYVQTGLALSTTYFYIVTAVNAVGESAPSAQVSATTTATPPIPSPPVASAVGGFGVVTISWPAVTGATSYNIYWAATSGVGPLNGNKISVPTSPFDHPGRTASTTYYYVVTAVNSTGESAPSPQISATTTAAPVAPAAPTGVVATGAANQVSITWPAVGSATSYNIYWSPTSGTGIAGTKITGATSPYTLALLADATPYYFVVTAVNAVGESPPSTQATATTSAPALNGAALYATNCESCHFPLATSEKRLRTATQIQTAINTNRGGMGSVSLRALTPAEVQAIATALNF